MRDRVMRAKTRAAIGATITIVTASGCRHGRVDAHGRPSEWSIESCVEVRALRPTRDGVTSTSLVVATVERIPTPPPAKPWMDPGARARFAPIAVLEGTAVETFEAPLTLDDADRLFRRGHVLLRVGRTPTELAPLWAVSVTDVDEGRTLRASIDAQTCPPVRAPPPTACAECQHHDGACVQWEMIDCPDLPEATCGVPLDCPQDCCPP